MKEVFWNKINATQTTKRRNVPRGTLRLFVVFNNIQHL